MAAGDRLLCGRGEIGRRTSLRSWRGNPSRFESGRSHGPFNTQVVTVPGIDAFTTERTDIAAVREPDRCQAGQPMLLSISSTAATTASARSSWSIVPAPMMVSTRTLAS